MKWVRVRSTGEPPMKSAEMKKSFVEYPDKATLQKDLKKNYGLWADYTFKKAINSKAREGYDMFCGGFLQFYDIEVRNNADPHRIYLEWGKNNVRIHISPKPKKNPDYGVPGGSRTDPPTPPPPPPPPMG